MLVLELNVEEEVAEVALTEVDEEEDVLLPSRPVMIKNTEYWNIVVFLSSCNLKPYVPEGVKSVGTSQVNFPLLLANPAVHLSV